jgi:hypothetical protein
VPTSLVENFKWQHGQLKRYKPIGLLVDDGRDDLTVDDGRDDLNTVLENIDYSSNGDTQGRH